MVANRDFENCKVKESMKYFDYSLDELSSVFIEVCVCVCLCVCVCVCECVCVCVCV